MQHTYFWWELTEEQQKVAIPAGYAPNGMSEEDAYSEGMHTFSQEYTLPTEE